MSTGTPGGTYDVYAQRYKAILARSGVNLRFIPSAGGAENLARLNDPSSGVMVAFAQSGLTSEAQSPDLESLGTLFYEPFWLFYRGADPGPRLEGLHGKKLSIALHPFLTKLVLPEGVGNMDADRPPTDLTLVAPKASLVVRRDLHPAIQYLLLDAAAEIHAVPDFF
jgi:hypothetical protein